MSYDLTYYYRSYDRVYTRADTLQAMGYGRVRALHDYQLMLEGKELELRQQELHLKEREMKLKEREMKLKERELQVREFLVDAVAKKAGVPSEIPVTPIKTPEVKTPIKTPDIKTPEVQPDVEEKGENPYKLPDDVEEIFDIEDSVLIEQVDVVDGPLIQECT